jgi:cell division GTPase FtsZ
MQGEMWVINTDAQVLASHLCPNKMQIGLESTRGLGCGGNPEVGHIAAEESEEGLKKVGDKFASLHDCYEPHTCCFKQLSFVTCTA